MKLLRNQKGFTLIELVMIIIILGILGATVIIRIADVQDAAENAAIRGIYGHIVSAYAITLASLRTDPPIASVNVNLGGDPGDITVNGSPTITIQISGNTIAGGKRQGAFNITGDPITDISNLALSDI